MCLAVTLTACSAFVGRAPLDAGVDTHVADADAASDVASDATSDVTPACDAGAFRGVVARSAQLGVASTDGGAPWDFHVKTATRDPAGRVLLAGGIRGCSLAGRFDAAVVRLRSDLQVDRTFGVDGRVCVRGPLASALDLVAYGVATDSRRRVVLVGEAFTRESHRRGLVVRLDESGSLDGRFATDGYLDYRPGVSPSDPLHAVVLHAVVIDGDDRVIVAGSNDHPFSRNSAGVLTRLDEDGSPDSTFNHALPVVDTATSGYYAVAKHGDDYLAVGSTTGTAFARVVRYNSLGALVESFGNNGASEHRAGRHLNARALGVDGIGRIYVSGGVSADYNDAASPPMIVRFQPDGEPDLSYGNSGAYVVAGAVWSFAYFFDRAMLVRCDGSALIGARVGANAAVTMLDPSGALEERFGIDGFARIPSPSASLFGGVSGIWIDHETGALRGVASYSNNVAQTVFEVRP